MHAFVASAWQPAPEAEHLHCPGALEGLDHLEELHLQDNLLLRCAIDPDVRRVCLGGLARSGFFLPGVTGTCLT